MKVAVVLTGHLRTFEMLKYLHLNSLILPYNADVFLGINILQCDNKQDTFTTIEYANKAIDFYKPINSYIFDDSEYGNYKLKHHKHHGILIQYYVVKKTYEMLKIYSDDYNIKYDLIIRLRFDQLLFSKEVPIAPVMFVDKKILYCDDNIEILKKYSIGKKFIFEEVNDNTLYVFGFGDVKQGDYKYTNDQFFYHNHTLLEQMMNFHDNIETIHQYCEKNNIGNKGARIECILHLYITRFNNITLKKGNISGIFIRQLKCNNS